MFLYGSPFFFLLVAPVSTEPPLVLFAPLHVWHLVAGHRLVTSTSSYPWMEWDSGSDFWKFAWPVNFYYIEVSIYYIWRENMEKKAYAAIRLVDQLAKLIEKTVRLRILFSRYHEKLMLVDFLQRWFSAHVEQW